MQLWDINIKWKVCGDYFEILRLEEK